MIEIILNDPILYKIAIDGEKYLVYYKDRGSPAEFNRKECQGCTFEKHLNRLERKAKLTKLLSQ